MNAFSKVRRWLILNHWITTTDRRSVDHSFRHRVNPNLDFCTVACNCLLSDKTPTDTTHNVSCCTNLGAKANVNSFFLFLCCLKRISMGFVWLDSKGKVGLLLFHARPIDNIQSLILQLALSKREMSPDLPLFSRRIDFVKN